MPRISTKGVGFEWFFSINDLLQKCSLIFCGYGVGFEWIFTINIYYKIVPSFSVDWIICYKIVPSFSADRIICYKIVPSFSADMG